MAAQQVYAISRVLGTTSEVIPVWIAQQSLISSTGAGLANIVASTVAFAWYRNDMAAVSSGTCTTGTLGTYAVSSFVQANSTAALGWYNFCPPNGIFVSGRSAAITLTGPSMAPTQLFIELTKTDNQTPLSSSTVSTLLLNNVTQILGSAPVTSAPGLFSVNVSTLLGSNPTTNAAGVLSVDLKTIFGSAPVTTAAGVLAAAWDLGRTANLTSTIALTATSLSSNLLVNVNQILGSTPVTSAAGTLQADLASIFGSAPVTTAAGIMAHTWDLSRTANLTSTIALPGTSISTNILVGLNQIFGSAPVTTGPGVLSAGITGTQTYNITGSLSGSVGSVTGSVASVAGAVGSVTGLTAAFLDVSVSSRLAAVGYTAPLSAADTRTAVGLASANLDTQLATLATSTDLTAVKAKTDSLSFTVPGKVDANIKSLNDVSIVGDGSGTPFNVP